MRRASERDREKQKAADRDGDTRTFCPRQPLGDEQRQNADATRRGRLHERERSEGQRSNVEHPPPQPCHETREPAALREQRAQGRDRPPQRERRQRRRGAVLGDVPPVERDRRGECERQRKGELHRWKGRYASAASAASETRGRSSRRS